MHGTANHFPAKNVLNCRILHTQAHNFFEDDMPPDSRKRPPVVDTNFRLARYSVPIVPIYETTTLFQRLWFGIADI